MLICAAKYQAWNDAVKFYNRISATRSSRISLCDISQRKNCDLKQYSVVACRYILNRFVSSIDNVKSTSVVSVLIHSNRVCLWLKMRLLLLFDMTSFGQNLRRYVVSTANVKIDFLRERFNCRVHSHRGDVNWPP